MRLRAGSRYVILILTGDAAANARMQLEKERNVQLDLLRNAEFARHTKLVPTKKTN